MFCRYIFATYMRKEDAVAALLDGSTKYGLMVAYNTKNTRSQRSTQGREKFDTRQETYSQEEKTKNGESENQGTRFY